MVVRWPLAGKEITQRVIFGKIVLQSFDYSRRGDGTGDECHADWVERLWRERFGGESGPETMAIAGDSDESRDRFFADEIINLGALPVGAAGVSHDEGCIT